MNRLGVKYLNWICIWWLEKQGLSVMSKHLCQNRTIAVRRLEALRQLVYLLDLCTQVVRCAYVRRTGEVIVRRDMWFRLLGVLRSAGNHPTVQHAVECWVKSNQRKYIESL